MDSSVTVKSLTKKFGDFTAVNNISFEVNKGEIFGFLGPNGAGKSTTIKMLCGILAPSSGNGSVAGFDIMKDQDKIKTKIGYMSQKFSLYPDLTVEENLRFFGSIYGLDGDFLDKRIKYVLNMAGIENRKDLVIANLPGGIKQRLALGGAMLHDPPVLFLDEPTSGVDPIMRRNFWEIIYEFSRAGKTIFVTTHYMDEAEHCDRIALIIAGEIIALDSPKALKDSLSYNVYSLTVPEFIKVFNEISNLDFIKEAAIFGSSIHLLSEKNFPFITKLNSELKLKKITHYKIEKIPPTLEDVFVTHSRRLGV